MRKTFITLDDIVGMALECRNPECGASLLLHPDKLESLASEHNTALIECPTCKQPWAGPPDRYPVRKGFDSEIKQLIRLICEVRKAADKLGCALTLEVKPEILANQK